MSQIDPDFSSIQIITRQFSDSWLNKVIIESLTHGMYMALFAIALLQILSSTTIHRRQVKILAGISGFMYIMATMHRQKKRGIPATLKRLCALKRLAVGTCGIVSGLKGEPQKPTHTLTQLHKLQSPSVYLILSALSEAKLSLMNP
ncbi:uncharacterized protein EV420DRAFT_1650821 [Desarmillaria tabescens]|uniref:Uncharacterized protein n=1 Tax=Armillaria tabescens TaxID=1929756 RepID=A0AA39JCV9_ARMTA|nr:uncharacterized protein EV420DRAFT_1650821 [Desarmillaria tabescens]KAK0439707.1 hypothetical protein EV420DRAFT_1650821 [Desarmillaria tabescens]